MEGERGRVDRIGHLNPQSCVMVCFLDSAHTVFFKTHILYRYPLLIIFFYLHHFPPSYQELRVFFLFFRESHSNR
jgi:hypothetical protein